MSESPKDCGGGNRCKTEALQHATRQAALNQTTNEPETKSTKREDAKMIGTGQQMLGTRVSQAVTGMRVESGSVEDDGQGRRRREEANAGWVHTVRCCFTMSLFKWAIGPSATMEPRSMM